jgi:hypothetical protein
MGTTLGLDANAHDKPPTNIKAAPRLHEDVQALTLLFSAEKPSRRTIHSNKISEFLYMCELGLEVHSGLEKRFTICMDNGIPPFLMNPPIIES